MKKKVFCFLMVSSLLAGSISAQAASFTDMKDVPWSGAETYINKAADLGLMVGSDDLKGKKVFKPKNNITYSETAQLIYSLMKTTGQINGSTDYSKNWISVMSSYKVPSWAYQAVGFCLTEGIINISDVSEFTNPQGKDKSATRENVAVMFGKGLKDIVPQKGGTSFNDTKNISAAALEYVSYLGGLGVLSGDSDKNFNPRQPINRSEMAVIVTKVHGLLQEKGGPKTAIITQIEKFGQSTLLTLSMGSESRTFSISNTTIVRKGTTALTIADLGIYDTIEIEYDGAVVKSINITDDFQVEQPKKDNGGSKTDDTKVSKTYEGTLSHLSEKKIAVYTSSKSTKEFELASNVDIEFDGKDVDYDKLYKYYRDYDKIQVKVGVNKEDVVIEIEAEENTTVSGTVKDIDKSKITVGSKKYYFADEDDMTIKIDSSKNRSIKQLISAFDDTKTLKVEMKLKNDEVVDIVATTAEYDDDDDDSGDANGLVKDLTNSEIKIGSKTYKINSDASVSVKDGKENDLIKKVTELYNRWRREGKRYNVSITLKNDKVTKITGEVVEIIDCTVTYANASKNKIEVQCDSGTYTYYTNSKTKIKIDGDRNQDLDDLEDAIDNDKNDDVVGDLVLENGYVTEIDVDFE